jgi:hypothetical protein
MSIKQKPGRPDAENRQPNAKDQVPAEDYVPLSVRRARQMRQNLWPHVWMSFASILILATALAILSYRIGAQGCH